MLSGCRELVLQLSVRSLCRNGKIVISCSYNLLRNDGSPSQSFRGLPTGLLGVDFVFPVAFAGEDFLGVALWELLFVNDNFVGVLLGVPDFWVEVASGISSLPTSQGVTLSSNWLFKPVKQNTAMWGTQVAVGVHLCSLDMSSLVLRLHQLLQPKLVPGKSTNSSLSLPTFEVSLVSEYNSVKTQQQCRNLLI